MDLRYIAELKSRIDDAHELKDSLGESYFVKIVYRGEGLFYCQDNRAFICDLSIDGGGFIGKKSIKKWDNRKKISDEEKEAIYLNIARFFRETDKTEVSFV